MDVGDIVDAVEPVRQCRFAETRVRRRDDAVSLREQANKRIVGPYTTGAMQEQDWRSTAALEQLKVNASDRHGVAAVRHVIHNVARPPG
jgi:hypothetical protein